MLKTIHLHNSLIILSLLIYLSWMDIAPLTSILGTVQLIIKENSNNQKYHVSLNRLSNLCFVLWTPEVYNITELVEGYNAEMRETLMFALVLIWRGTKKSQLVISSYWQKLLLVSGIVFSYCTLTLTGLQGHWYNMMYSGKKCRPAKRWWWHNAKILLWYVFCTPFSGNSYGKNS